MERGTGHRRGAGNNGTTDPFYPAAFENVISVAAFDENHLRPVVFQLWKLGGHLGSWQRHHVYLPHGRVRQLDDARRHGCYTWETGTSMATPHVSGAAALAWSRSDVTSNRQVVDILLHSADARGRRLCDSTHGPSTWSQRPRRHELRPHESSSARRRGPDQTVRDSNRDGTELVTLNGSASSDRDGSHRQL
jgi:hypothetical protein